MSRTSKQKFLRTDVRTRFEGIMKKVPSVYVVKSNVDFYRRVEGCREIVAVVEVT